MCSTLHLAASKKIPEFFIRIQRQDLKTSIRTVSLHLASRVSASGGDAISRKEAETRNCRT